MYYDVPTAPFTAQLLQSTVGDSVLPLEDWMGIAKACVSPGEYLLWKTCYTELCGEQAVHNAAHGIRINSDMLLGRDPFEGVLNQLQFPIQAYQQMAIAAT
jgi:hypothetical protein